MDELIVSLDDRLADVGDTLPFVAHLGLDTFTFGERQFSLPAGIDCDLVLTNAGEGILVTGIARAEMVGTCDRCLDEARLELAAEVDAYYLFHEPDPGVLEQDEEEGPDFELVGADSTIDLNDAVDTALIMEIPYVVLCREDCRGLCPVCGENLNHVDCGHAEKLAAERERDRIASSPFAVLKDLDLD